MLIQCEMVRRHVLHSPLGQHQSLSVLLLLSIKPPLSAATR